MILVADIKNNLSIYFYIKHPIPSLSSKTFSKLHKTTPFNKSKTMEVSIQWDNIQTTPCQDAYLDPEDPEAMRWWCAKSGAVMTAITQIRCRKREEFILAKLQLWINQKAILFCCKKQDSSFYTPNKTINTISTTCHLLPHKIQRICINIVNCCCFFL